MAATHKAIAITKVGAPLELIDVPTASPDDREIKVRAEWVSATPVVSHQADGGLFVTPPTVVGGTVAGEVLEVGPGVKYFRVGDKVAGWLGPIAKQKGWQYIIVGPETSFSRWGPETPIAGTAPFADAFVTAWHTLGTILGLPLPFPKPKAYVPPHSDSAILVWGGSGSAGQFLLQVLKHFGYKNVITTASKRQHDLVLASGATKAFDYRDANVVSEILEAAGPAGIPYIIDCAGSKDDSILPISRLAKSGSHVAIVLPILNTRASAGRAPDFGMDPSVSAEWAEGVKVVPILAMQYARNPDLAENLLPKILPALLAERAVKPLRTRVVEGKTFLERGQKALEMLRNQEVSGERLVFRVADE